MQNYEEVNSPAPVLEEEHEYLSSRNAQIFMSRFNIYLPRHVLKTLNRYLVLFVKDLLKDECLSCPPSKFQLETIIESKMDSNSTYHEIIRDVSILEASSMVNTESFQNPETTLTFESQTKMFFSPFLNQLPSFLKTTHDSFFSKGAKLVDRSSNDQSKNSLKGCYLKEFMNNSTEYNEAKNTACKRVLPRSQLVIVAPWQIMYHCPMASSFSSISLLAHIEMAGAVLNTRAAKFMGTFISQLSLAILRELVRLTKSSKRAVLTTDILQKAFHPIIAYQPLKFPIFHKLQVKVAPILDERSKSIELEEQINITLSSPLYISQSAVSSALSYQSSKLEISHQSLLLLNRFLDEVVVSVTNKLKNDQLTIIQIQAALNLTLKACPMLKQAFKTVEKTFDSILAVPVKPIFNRQYQNKDIKIFSISTQLQQCRLVAQYFSPQSSFYQSQFIARFFSTQDIKIDIKASQYLAALLGQLGLELIFLARGLLERQIPKHNIITNHVLITALEHALPFCEVFSRLNIYSFKNTVLVSANSYSEIPISTTPSLSTSDSSSTCNSSIVADNTNLIKTNKVWDTPYSLSKRPISLPKLTSAEQSHFENDNETITGSISTRSSFETTDLPKKFSQASQSFKNRATFNDFDALLESDVTLRLTLTPSNLPR